MWTQTRHPPPSKASAEIASSKSRALSGSIVNVDQRAQVAALAGPRRRLRRGRLVSLALDRSSNEPRKPAVHHQRLEHVPGDVGAPQPP